MSRGPSVSFLVVGDMHRHWRDADRAFLESGEQDAVFFVGDLGDEDVDLVRDIARVRARKAVILGNHDAWQSFVRKRPTHQLRRSLELLGKDHLGYATREIPAAGISLVGARPFSWGGPSLRSAEIYEDLYDVDDMSASAQRILRAARDAQHRDIVILAHNGPTGLSRQPRDIFGKDFGRDVGGDWGDPDLEEAIAAIKADGLRVPCVVAGHMHNRLMSPRGEQRVRFVIHDSTLYVNAAVVPRVRKTPAGAVGHYLRMSWRDGALIDLEEIWVDPRGEVREAERPEIIDL